MYTPVLTNNVLRTESFKKYDVDHSGCIDAWELKEAMKSLGQNPTDDELFALLAQVDTVLRSNKLASFVFGSIDWKSPAGRVGEHRLSGIPSGQVPPSNGRFSLSQSVGRSTGH